MNRHLKKNLSSNMHKPARHLSVEKNIIQVWNDRQDEIQYTDLM